MTIRVRLGLRADFADPVGPFIPTSSHGDDEEQWEDSSKETATEIY